MTTAPTVATLRDLRVAAGMTQNELAEAVGITGAHVSFYESGRRAPAETTLARMAVALRVDPAGLRAALEASGPAERPMAARPVDRGDCGSCGRHVGHPGRARILPPPEYCGPCGRPLTEEAKRRAPLDGFVKFAVERGLATWSPVVESL